MLMQVMELSELHNPHCKLHASQSFDDHSPVRERRHSDVSDIFLSPEAYKATQAVEFIAEHLRNEDEYVQVRVFPVCGGSGEIFLCVSRCPRTLRQ